MNRITVIFKAYCKTSPKIKNIIIKSAKQCLNSVPQNILKKIFKQTQSKNISINIALVRKNEIRKLNKSFRHKNRFTDVLSFPRKIILYDLGDVVISPAIVKMNARRFNVNFYEELSRVTIHGILHIFGFSHEKSKKKAEKMFKLTEATILKIKSSEDTHNRSIKSKS